MNASAALREIKALIDLADGRLDDEGKPVDPPSLEKLDGLVTEIYELVEYALSGKRSHSDSVA